MQVNVNLSSIPSVKKLLGKPVSACISPHACITGWSRFKNGSVLIVFIIIFVAVYFEWQIL